MNTYSGDGLPANKIPMASDNIPTEQHNGGEYSAASSGSTSSPSISGDQGASDFSDEPFDYSYVPFTARIAAYDDLISAPRVIEVGPAPTAAFIESLASTIYDQARASGGGISYTIIREVSENLIHARFKEIIVSILDHGNTIRFADQGPGIQFKDKVQQPGYTSAIEPMKDYIRGVGSGLPIVKEYLEVSHGNITIEDNLGTGSVITISLQSDEAGNAALRPAFSDDGDRSSAATTKSYPSGGNSQNYEGGVFQHSLAPVNSNDPIPYVGTAYPQTHQNHYAATQDYSLQNQPAPPMQGYASGMQAPLPNQTQMWQQGYPIQTPIPYPSAAGVYGSPVPNGLSQGTPLNFDSIIGSMTEPQANILRFLFHEGESRITDIANILDRAQSSVFNDLRKLKEMTLIQQNSRKMYLLSELGKQIAFYLG